MDKLLEIPFAKMDEEKQLVYGVVYEPGVVDAQGDWADAAEIEKACHGFMKDCRVVKLMHKDDLDENSAQIVESYIAPQAMDIGGQQVRKGSWVLGVHVLDKGVWESIKKGELSGFSMGGFALGN